MSTIIIEIEISIQTEEYPKVLSDLKIETRFSASIFSLPVSKPSPNSDIIRKFNI